MLTFELSDDIFAIPDPAEIQVPYQAEFTLVVPSRAYAGYVWRASGDIERLRVTSRRYVEILGGGEREHLTFKLLNRSRAQFSSPMDSTVIVLTLQRPWEPVPIEQRSIAVRVMRSNNVITTKKPKTNA